MGNTKEPIRWSRIVRRILALSLTAVVLILALGSATYPIWIEALKALTIPFSVILGGYFGTEMIKNNKKNYI